MSECTEFGRQTVGYQRWIVTGEKYQAVVVDLIDERFGSPFDSVSHRSIELTPDEARKLAADLIGRAKSAETPKTSHFQ